MANMSYCRFRNTSQALHDCLYALGYRGEEPDDDISCEEIVAGKNMFESFLDFCEEMEIIEGFDRTAVGALFARTEK